MYIIFNLNALFLNKVSRPNFLHAWCDDVFVALLLVCSAKNGESMIFTFENSRLAIVRHLHLSNK